MKLKIRIKKIKDNLYLASCPDLEGCHVQASSEKEAEVYLKAAIQAYINSYKQRYEKLPLK
jgi:predicted RNase H-like HicB family nuclease